MSFCLGSPVLAQPGDAPPRVMHPAPLFYPRDGGGTTAVVKLRLSLDEAGQLVEAVVVSTEPPSAAAGFREAALAHARALHFAPATRAGTPIPSVVTLDLRIAPPADPGPPEPVPQEVSGLRAPERTQAGRRTDLRVPARLPRPGPLPLAARGPGPDGAEARPPLFRSTVRGGLIQGERAVSDYNIDPDKLRVVPRRSAAELLTLAPGILLVNHGGEGHALQVFLRGFDAREGQDVEFSTNGVPVNEVANAHGQGYADTHFIIPELVDSLRVLEGPFDPRQGDFAVAGSAEYRLQVRERGLRLSYRGGSFNSHRLLLLWAPPESLSPRLARPGTFGAVELSQSDGYGQNRFSQRAAAAAQYEAAIGESGSLSVLLLSYATRFKSPGVIRQDDYEAGRMGFYDTYDRMQGGDSMRHSVSADLRGKAGPLTLRQMGFLVLRDLRLRENFTGFLLDPQRAGQSDRGAHPQRGDLIDQNTSELTLGARGSLAYQITLRGLRQQLEVGYYARHDRNDARQLRLRSGTVVPYRTDFSFFGVQSNVAGYLDVELHLTGWLSLRGGVRGDFFHFSVENRCDNKDDVLARAPPDVECPSLDRYGYRNPSARRSATGLLVQPRATLTIEPLSGLLITGSYGHGARSADPLFLGDGDDAPFASIRAAEAGALYHRAFAPPGGGGLFPIEMTVRAAFYHTHVDRDLIFNQQLGRNTLANGTTRLGIVASSRVTAPFFDTALSLTWARATFDDDGLLVPYVPDLVVRADAAVFGEIPRLRIAGNAFMATLGAGFTYVAPRPLPLSERGDAYVLLDLSARLRFHAVEVGVAIENVLDRRYRLAEFNYVSDFRSAAFPTLLASRHFVAGPPLTALATVTLFMDDIFRELSRIK